MLIKSAELLYTANGDVALMAKAEKDQRNEILSMLQKTEELLQKGKQVELILRRQHRSLDANAYAWKLITELAERLTAEAQGDTAYTKDDVYLMMLKKYGQGGIVKLRHEDIDKFKRAWKYSEEHEKLLDENAAYYRFWVGSSNYDTGEMYLFVCGIVADCKELGIETRTPDELNKLISLWETPDEKIIQ